MAAVYSDYIIQSMLHSHYNFTNPDVFIKVATVLL